jgi:four helix bundle protein
MGEAGTGNAEQGPQMAAVADYRGLKVWQGALALAESIYANSQAFPVDERFGLTSQLRRAAVSVPSCIAEGNARNSTRDDLRFLYMASGSLAEIETQLILANRLGYLPETEMNTFLPQLHGVHKLSQALKGALTRKNPTIAPSFPVPRSRPSS